MPAASCEPPAARVAAWLRRGNENGPLMGAARFVSSARMMTERHNDEGVWMAAEGSDRDQRRSADEDGSNASEDPSYGRPLRIASVVFAVLLLGTFLVMLAWRAFVNFAF